MTLEQINHIVTVVLEDKMDTLTRLKKCKYMVMIKQEFKSPALKNMLFHFDSSTQLLYCYPARVYSTDANIVPDHGYSQTFTDENGTVVFELLTETDSDGETHILFDTYDINRIMEFIINWYDVDYTTEGVKIK